MNGKTDINEILNPCSAAADKSTYGLRWFNFTTYGERLFRLTLFGIVFDFYKSRYGVFYSRIANAGIFFHPFGSITWPMPNINPKGNE